MSFDLRRRCELTLTRVKAGKITQDEALKDIFRMMKLPDAAKVRSSEFQAYIDTIMPAEGGPKDMELEVEVFKSWKNSGNE
jgi:hypothetical protein